MSNLLDVMTSFGIGRLLNLNLAASRSADVFTAFMLHLHILWAVVFSRFLSGLLWARLAVFLACCF